MAPRFAYLDHPGPLPFAHRGGAKERPENSMAAFAHAVGLGYRYLETDVHATRDGALIAFHDATLDRTTDHAGRVTELPWREVAKARIAGTEPIPLLTDLLEAWPEARLNIDVKSVGAIQPLADVIRKTGAYDRICVTSFSERRLAAARRAIGRPVCTALGPRGVAALKIASYASGFNRILARLAREGVPCVQIPPFLGALRVTTRALVTTAHALGMHVHVWTVDDPHEMNRLLDLGVDGVMTDRVTALREVLLARGQWHPPERPPDE
ncbi:glycerophosphodiester phosphodiesterase [Rhizohabitans arisaemae]|uniref:glycerophosphodiester phosphodiesterase n=1 Tax=Rhizohabitans arisaemae TaxID=2720610 RepID=UPI0024B0BECD|nr:glycerophosphodiester phosphodiesterase [Rhizohabitans arisaemae]